MAIANKERLNWLIIEDSLRDFHGHFLEFVCTFVRGFHELGDEVSVLGARGSLPAVIEQTGCLPVMPDAKLRTGSLRSPMQVLMNIYWILSSLWVLFSNNRVIDRSDVVFLTAVRLQHLILWKLYSAIRGKRFQTPLLLFFMATPIAKRAGGSGYEWEGLHGRAIGFLVNSLSAGNGGKQVRCFTETRQLSAVLSNLSGIAFETVPQPIQLEPLQVPSTSISGEQSILTIGSFGPPREEKGSHLLLKALKNIRLKSNELPFRFILHWTEDFTCSTGELAMLPPELLQSGRFRAITQHVDSKEYDNLLSQVDAIILPYGENYDLRGSRVLVEALVRGLPVAVTAGSSMQELAQSYGKCVVIEEWTESAIEAALHKLNELNGRWTDVGGVAARKAQEYFSVAEFRRRWLAGSL